MNKASTTNDGYRSMVSISSPGDLGNTYVVMQGWQCPRCRKINNPSLPQCLCEPPRGATLTSPVGEWDWDGTWHGLDGPVDFDEMIQGESRMDYGSPA